MSLVRDGHFARIVHSCDSFRSNFADLKINELIQRVQEGLGCAVIRSTRISSDRQQDAPAKLILPLCMYSTLQH